MTRLPASVRACAFVVVAAACNYAPQYKRPDVSLPAAFKEAAAGMPLPPGTWRPATPRDAALKGKWWELFGEPELDALEERLNMNNQNIAQAFEQFLAARAQVSEARASYYPTVSLGPTYNLFVLGNVAGGGRAGSVGISGAGGTTGGGGGAQGGTRVINTFSLPLDISWAPDLWGRVRNTVREFQYAAQLSAADLENTRLTAQASLAEFYFQLRGQDALQDVYARTIEVDRQSLELTRARAETGVDTWESVAQAEVTLAGVQAAATGVAVNRALFEHAIATLIGTPASRFALPRRPLATPVPQIPVGVPSQLLERRPDIAAAERGMAQWNAAIGVARAAYFPTVTLSPAGGLQSSSLTALFSVPALFFSLGVAVSETLFDGGLRRATLQQYWATYRANVAAYRQTVLTAFQQVEDYLATVRIVSQQIMQQTAAVEAARRFLAYALARYQTGIDPYLNVITAQTTLLSDELTLVTLRVTEMTAAVQLVQALGGGWDVSQLPSPAEVTKRRTPERLR